MENGIILKLITIMNNKAGQQKYQPHIGAAHVFFGWNYVYFINERLQCDDVYDDTTVREHTTLGCRFVVVFIR